MLNNDPYPIWMQGFDAGCIPFHHQQYRCAVCTARSMDAQGVFLSATNSVNMHGVRLYKC